MEHIYVICKKSSGIKYGIPERTMASAQATIAIWKSHYEDSFYTETWMSLPDDAITDEPVIEMLTHKGDRDMYPPYRFPYRTAQGETGFEERRFSEINTRRKFIRRFIKEPGNGAA